MDATRVMEVALSRTWARIRLPGLSGLIPCIALRRLPAEQFQDAPLDHSVALAVVVSRTASAFADCIRSVRALGAKLPGSAQHQPHWFRRSSCPCERFLNLTA
jgi:hypothetical protein